MTRQREWLMGIVSFFVFLCLCTLSLPARGAEGVPIRIGWQPAQEARFYMARELNYFEQEGLKPEYVKFTAGPPAFAALQSKSIDINLMGAVPAVSAISQGIKIKIILLEDDSSMVEGLVVKPGSGINKVGDLVGKKVGATKGSTSWFALFKALDFYKIDPKRVQILDLPFPTLIPAFNKNDVDALWVWSPWVNKLMVEGNKVICRDRDVGVQFGTVWVAREEWLKENPEAAVSFLRALDRGTSAFKKDPKTLEKIIGVQLGLTPEVVVDLLSREYYPDFSEQANPAYGLSLVSPGGLAKALQGISDFMYSQKINASAPSMSEYVDPSFLKKSLEGRK